MKKGILSLLSTRYSYFYNILVFILLHPLSKKHKIRSLFNLLSWQLNQVISPHLIIYEWVNSIKVAVKKGMTGITGSIYVGLHEFEDMSFILHYLDKETLFLDIGANVGCYSLLAASNNSQVIAFEPDKESVSALNVNKAINDFDNITIISKAVGDHVGFVNFSEKLDTTNHVLDISDSSGNLVPMTKIDSMDLGDGPIVIKIDVEGYELHVLKGAHDYLINNVSAVVVETNNSNIDYGSSNNEIYQLLNELGFSGYTYNPFTRKFSNIGPERIGNTIFLKDIDKVAEKVLKADTVAVMSERI